MKPEDKIERIKKAQLLLLVLVIIDFVALIFVGALQGPQGVFIVLSVNLIGLGIAELVLSRVRVHINRKKIEDNSNKPSYTHHPNPKPSEDDLPENIKIREKIWKFDAFVRDNFENLPLEEFYFDNSQLNELKYSLSRKELTAEVLKPLVNTMIKHLNQTFNYANIVVNRVKPGETDHPGYIDGNRQITVNYDGVMPYMSVLALLAHEISHAYQFYEFRKYPGETLEVEEFTDFLTYYLGFGNLVDNGHRYFDKDTPIRLGYLNDYALSFSKTAMNARKTMRDIKRKEDEEIAYLKNNIKQTADMIPEYIHLISAIVDNLSHCQTLESEDMSEIGNHVTEYQNYYISEIRDLNEQSIKENDVDKLKDIYKKMSAKAKTIFDLYVFFNIMNEKYQNK